MTNSMNSEESMVDKQLRSEMQELRSDLAGLALPEFSPSRPSRLPVLAAAAAIIGLAIGGWFMVADNPTVIDTSPASAPDNADETVDPEPASPPEVSTATISAEDLANYNTSKDKVVLDDLDLPRLGETVVDPAFGGRITRITDAGEGNFITPQSPTAFNADETRALLYMSGEDGPQHLLYDLENLVSPEVLDINPADIEQVYWSRTNPTELHYVERGSANLVTINVVTKERTTFKGLGDCDVASSGLLPAPPSADGKVWGLICSEGDSPGLMSHTFGEMTSSESTTLTKMSDQLIGLFPSMSGQKFIQLADDGSGIVLDAELVETGVSLALGGNDFATAVDHQGRDIVIAALFEELAGTAVSFDLETGAATVLVGPETGYDYPPTGTRHSASLVNGVFALKTQGSGFSSGTPRVGDDTLLAGELVLVDTRGAQISVHRLAHHRESGDSKWGKAFISLSPSGTKMLFSSDWFRGDSVDTFLIDLQS